MFARDKLSCFAKYFFSIGHESTRYTKNHGRINFLDDVGMFLLGPTIHTVHTLLTDQWIAYLELEMEGCRESVAAHLVKKNYR